MLCAGVEVQTMNKRPNSLEEYLAATSLCDCDDPWLRRKTKEIINGATTPEEKALKTFYYVRDNIRFSMAYSRSKASQILQLGYGECLTKTNAHVALLRAAGIPARMHWVMVQANVLRGLITDFMFRFLAAEVSHFWAECYLRGHWISCEAFLDRPLYEGMLTQGLITKEQIPTIDWDGKNDLILLKTWITNDRGSVSSADEAWLAYQNNGEGAPPLWIERLMAPLIIPYNRRFSDRIRRLVEA
jgi:transglutaminase-like putative cysteine protease